MAVPPEKNPPGDIPDTQVFITYRAPAGYALKVPEGWAAAPGANVRFADKLDAVQVTVQPAPRQIDLHWVRARYMYRAEKRGARGASWARSRWKSCPPGGAFRIAYADNSAPNPVTGKQVGWNTTSISSNGGKLAALNLSAPSAQTTSISGG